MTHRNTADYFAGIPQYAGRISPADLNAAKAAAWDEGMNAGLENVARRAWEDGDLITNPYREVS